MLEPWIKSHVEMMNDVKIVRIKKMVTCNEVDELQASDSQKHM